MNKCLLLIAAFSLFSGGIVLAQTIPDKEDQKEPKKETVDAGVVTTDKPAPVVKVVPAARSKKAKPAKVGSAKPRSARPPGGNRSARTPRSSARPARPGNGRN